MEIASEKMRADARRNYDLLITTATKMLALPGVNFSFNELAKRAGVGIGTLYRHFPTKHDLLEAVYARELSALNNKTFAETPADQALEKWLQKLVTYSKQSPGFEFLIVDASNDARSPLFAAAARLLRAAQDAKLMRSDVNTSELLGLIKGIVSTPGGTRELNKMLSVIIAGLKK